MALQVWLPLNGDLTNQGLGNIVVTNNGATVDNNGKIGKCYSFDGTDDRISIDGLLLENNWSYGCWFNSAPSTRSWEAVILLNMSSGDADTQLGFYTYPGASRMQSTANGQYNSNISFTSDSKWHHFFATFNGSSLLTYLDGDLINTKSISAGLLQRTKLTLGARVNDTGFSSFFSGKINDVRIYDHCLSPKEVKEIAQGLILHYKLDGNDTYDCSGYSHAATQIGSNITLNNNTPRYTKSTFFDADARYTYSQIFPTDMLLNEITLATWIKRDYNDATTRYFFQGILQAYIYTDFKFRISWQAVDLEPTYDQGNTWAPGILLPNNEWHHIAFVLKNGIFYVYFDGVKKGSNTRHQYIKQVNAYNYSTSKGAIGGTFIGDLSDIRLYATALTDEAIAELYNTSAIIDNKQNLYSREFIEDERQDITKTGIYYSDELVEASEIQIHKDGQTVANNLYEF